MLSDILAQDKIGGLSLLTLAAVGDSVYDLMVRARLCAGGTTRARALHGKRVLRVRAGAQAAAAEAIRPLLDAAEADIFRRGRNARTNSQPKAATREQYQTATALEALMGWLYLQGREGRLRELFEVMMDEIEKEADVQPGV